MKRKTSITLSESTLRALDALTDEGSNRSRVIERAVEEFIERHRRAARDARDREILDAVAGELNEEVEDTLSYQVAW